MSVNFYQETGLSPSITGFVPLNIGRIGYTLNFSRIAEFGLSSLQKQIPKTVGILSVASDLFMNE